MSGPSISTQVADLMAGLNPAFVAKNPKGMSYIGGEIVIAELNRIFGPHRWSYTVTRLDICDAESVQLRNGDGVSVAATALVCLTVTFVDGSQVMRQDTGSGSGVVRVGSVAVADARESASKEAVTDALKRCARTLGPPFGLSLYAKDNPIHSGGADSWGRHPEAVAAAPATPEQAPAPREHSQWWREGGNRWFLAHLSEWAKSEQIDVKDLYDAAAPWIASKSAAGLRPSQMDEAAAHALVHWLQRGSGGRELAKHIKEQRR